jgi:cytochrome c biogenesis factor
MTRLIGLVTIILPALLMALVTVFPSLTVLAADELAATPSTPADYVAGGGAVSAAGFLWMLIRKMDAFLDRIAAHFQTEEAAMNRIAQHIDRWSLKAEIARENPVSDR